jgi:hypothetical protein
MPRARHKSLAASCGHRGNGEAAVSFENWPLAAIHVSQIAKKFIATSLAKCTISDKKECGRVLKHVAIDLQREK